MSVTDVLFVPMCALFAFCCLYEKAECIGHASSTLLSRSTSNPLQGDEIATLRIVKRQLSGFEVGSMPTIKLIFVCAQRVHVRWFVLNDSFNALNAEVSNMLPVEGHPDYEISTLSSGEVTAAILSIGRFDAASLPFTAEAILTTVDGATQYQIKTVVNEPTSHRLDIIDSPVWTAIPPATWTFSGQDQLTVVCEVAVPHERQIGFNNELKLLRLDEPTQYNDIGRSLRSVASVHQDMSDPLTEQHSDIMIYGERRTVPPSHTGVYEVRMSTTNESHAYAGLYMCAFERHHEKMYAISSIQFAGAMSPTHEAPTAAIKSCAVDNYDSSKKVSVLTLRPGIATCLRCGGFGSPPLLVAFYRGTSEVTPSPEIGVTNYTNVADAGIAEATITFRSPTNQVAGMYSCIVSNDAGSSNSPFQVVF